jgi:hypothetical protein
VERKTNRMVRISAIAVALGMTVMTLNAQPQGSFNLPFQAHWGPITLQPGEHVVRAPFTAGQAVVSLTTDKATSLVVPMTTESTGSFGHAYLRVVRVGGEYYVNTYQSATGKRYSFATPKGVHPSNPQRNQGEVSIVKVVAK